MGVQVRVLFLALKWFRRVSALGVPVSFPLTVDLSQMLSQKNGLGCATTRMHALVGGGGVAMSEQIADAQKVP